MECIDYSFTPSPSYSPASYRDALLRSPAPASGSPAPAAMLLAVEDQVVPGKDGACGGDSAPRARKKHRQPFRCVRRRNPPPPLVATSPCAGDGQPLSHELAARLGPVLAPATSTGPRRRPREDDNDFQEYVSRSTQRRLHRETVQSPPSPPPRRSHPSSRAAA